MGAKFHINQKGEPDICGATTRACPLGGEHDDDFEDAMRASMARQLGGEEEEDYHSFGPKTVANAAEVLARFGLTVKDYGLDEGEHGDMDFYEDVEGLPSGQAAWDFMSEDKKEHWTAILEEVAEEKGVTKPSGAVVEPDGYREFAAAYADYSAAALLERAADATRRLTPEQVQFHKRLAEEKLRPWDEQSADNFDYLTGRAKLTSADYGEYLEHRGITQEEHFDEVQRRSSLNHEQVMVSDIAGYREDQQKRERAVDLAPHLLAAHFDDHEAILYRREFAEWLMEEDAATPGSFGSILLRETNTQTIENLRSDRSISQLTELFAYEKRFGKLD